jgi:hypothetical protein
LRESNKERTKQTLYPWQRLDGARRVLFHANRRKGEGFDRRIIAGLLSCVQKHRARARETRFTDGRIAILFIPVLPNSGAAVKGVRSAVLVPYGLLPVCRSAPSEDVAR